MFYEVHIFGQEPAAEPIAEQPAAEQPKQPAAVVEMVEVCRSFAYKLNLQHYGGPQYESADFFASRKLQCNREDAEWVSQQIFEECVAEVRASVATFIEQMQGKKARKIAQKEAAA